MNSVKPFLVMGGNNKSVYKKKIFEEKKEEFLNLKDLWHFFEMPQPLCTSCCGALLSGLRELVLDLLCCSCSWTRCTCSSILVQSEDPLLRGCSLYVHEGVEMTERSVYGDNSAPHLSSIFNGCCKYISILSLEQVCNPGS